jgi:predicted metal-dependent phosphoesterase TrpH
MPARQPFTALCKAAARSRTSGRADLHLHTTHSDGTYTPAQIVELARRSGLAAVAITDHDTVAGLASARAAAEGSALEVIAGLEVSAEHWGREFHLLGYFVDPAHDALAAALERLRHARTGRFWEMVERLRACGVAVDDSALVTCAAMSVLGRRNLAEVLVQTGQVGSVREAFARYLSDNGRVTVPKVRLDVATAIGLVRAAGGVAAWAHPSYDCTRKGLSELRGLGLDAVEVAHPTARASRSRELRGLATELGLAATAGSDCHGPGHPSRAVGACSVTAEELERLRSRASC